GRRCRAWRHSGDHGGYRGQHSGLDERHQSRRRLKGTGSPSAKFRRMAARSATRRPPLATLARRWFAVVLVVLIGYAYYHPLRSWLEKRHDLSSRNAEVSELAAQKRSLLERVEASATTRSLAREARRLGYIRPGEHLFIVKGIQSWKNAHHHR